MLIRRSLASVFAALLAFGAALGQAGTSFADERVSGIADENAAVIRGSNPPAEADVGPEDSSPATENVALDADGRPSAAPPPPGSYEPFWGVAADAGQRCVDLAYRSDVPPN